MVIEYRTLPGLLCAHKYQVRSPNVLNVRSLLPVTPLSSQLSLTTHTLFLSYRRVAPQRSEAQSKLGAHVIRAYNKHFRMQGGFSAPQRGSTKVNMPILHTAAYLSNCYSSSKLFILTAWGPCALPPRAARGSSPFPPYRTARLGRQLALVSLSLSLTLRPPRRRRTPAAAPAPPCLAACCHCVCQCAHEEVAGSCPGRGGTRMGC